MLLSWPAKIAVLLLFFGYLAVSIVGEHAKSPTAMCTGLQINDNGHLHESNLNIAGVFMSLLHTASTTGLDVCRAGQSGPGAAR